MAKPKKDRKRSNNRFVAIPVQGTLALSTLANVTLLTESVLPAALTENFYAISIDINAQIIALTAGEGDPMMLGFAHGDYTDAEIEENIEVSYINPGDKIAMERARRLVRNSGMMSPQTEAATTMRLFGREGSGLVRTTLKFVINSGVDLKIWVYNQSGAALTTGSSLRFQGKLFGRWIL